MISLPPTCTIAYPITITIQDLTEEMIEWYGIVGGEVAEFKTNTFNRKNEEIVHTMVRYGNAKWCHRFQDSTGTVRLSFTGEDAPIASIFLLKFSDQVVGHNFR